MTCPDLYLNSTYWTTPHPANYSNPAIDVGAGGITFVRDVARTIQVTVRNHGTDDSPNSRLQLFWSDPTTGFAAVAARQIGTNQDMVVFGGDGITDGAEARNFGWTPDASVLAVNGGHLCLLARVENLDSPTGVGCTVQGYTATPATDARSAIRNIFVVAPPPPPPMPRPGGGGGGPGGFEPMNFAFAATNTLLDLEDTRLEVRALDPGNDKDRDKIQALFTDRAVYRELACCNRKFAVPDGVFVAEGRERVLLPRAALLHRRHQAEIDFMPRLGRLGTFSTKRLKPLIFPGAQLTEPKGPLDFKLASGEMRQTLLVIKPSTRVDRPVFAVEVDHKGADGRPIGGLTMLFLPPLSPF